MATPTPSLVIRKHDPAQRRRAWFQLGLVWLGSLLIVGALVAYFTARGTQHEGVSRLAAVDKETDALKSRIAVLERSEQVAKAALADVQQSLREREEEVDGLRADLAFYGRLVGGSKREGLAVHVLRLRPVKNSQAWNVVATLTQNFKRGQDIKGRLTMSVEGVQGDKLTTLDWAALAQGQEKSGIEYGFKYFQQVGGTIMLPVGFVPNRVIVRADGEGARVEQEFSWKDATKGEESDDVRK
jgi:hypothetical protein